MEPRIRSFFEAAPQGIIAMSEDGRIQLVNAQTEELFGYRREELVGQPLEILLPERFQEAHRRARARYFLNPRRMVLGMGTNVFGKRKNGSEFPVEVGLNLVETGDGKLVIGLISDITDRKRAADQLAAAEGKLRSFIEAAPQAILAVDRQGRIQLVNSRVEEMFGYSRDEILDKPLEILLPDRFRGPHTGHRNGYFNSPRVRPMGAGLDLAGRRKDGSEFPVEVGLSYVHSEEGDWALGLISDITERKRISDALAQANLELRRSNEELEQFAYIASHDLQEPLRMVTSYLQLLERRYGSKLDSEGVEFIRYAVDGAARMKALIAALLDYSRTGTRHAPREIVSCETVVKASLQNLKAAIDESEASIEVGALPKVTGDAVQLAQLFQNLIANAIKFRRGEVRIVISARQEPGLWVFAVRDNGIGIEPHYGERIFQVFQRLHSTDAYPGTGIGLAICKKIVERHGGRIWLESSLGEGSTFFFTIPANEEVADDHPNQADGHPVSGR